MTVLTPPAVSATMFTWEGGIGVAEASSLPASFGRVYDDACDEGLTVVSSRTGRQVVFVVDATVRDNDGDITEWVLTPVNPADASTVRGLRIFND